MATRRQLRGLKLSLIFLLRTIFIITNPLNSPLLGMGVPYGDVLEHRPPSMPNAVQPAFYTFSKGYKPSSTCTFHRGFLSSLARGVAPKHSQMYLTRN